MLRDVAYPLKGVKQDGTQYTIYQAAGGQRTIRIGKGTKLKGLPMHDSDSAAHIAQLLGEPLPQDMTILLDDMRRRRALAAAVPGCCSIGLVDFRFQHAF